MRGNTGLKRRTRREGEWGLGCRSGGEGQAGLVAGEADLGLEGASGAGEARVGDHRETYY